MVERNACYGGSNGHAVASDETLAGRALRLSDELQWDAEKFISECKNHGKDPIKVVNDVLLMAEYDKYGDGIFKSHRERAVFEKVREVCLSSPRW